MKDFNTQLPEDTAKLLAVFPDGRLCRLINRHSGTLLDVRPNLDVVNDDVPQVVGKLRLTLLCPFFASPPENKVIRRAWVCSTGLSHPTETDRRLFQCPRTAHPKFDT
ncbi:hypothetical protein B0H12DRAFT_152390 [Mycena haematopus]|nr:hypothetical protein B0H12DRAFT_152390 [Mycena haematopus]